MCTKKGSCEHVVRRWLPTSQRKKSQNVTYLTGALILDFSRFKTFRNKFPSFKPASHLWHFVMADWAKTGKREIQRIVFSRHSMKGRGMTGLCIGRKKYYFKGFPSGDPRGISLVDSLGFCLLDDIFFPREEFFLKTRHYLGFSTCGTSVYMSQYSRRLQL